MANDKQGSDPNNTPSFDAARMGDMIATRESAFDYMGLIGLLPDPDPVLFKLDAGPEVLAGVLADGHLTSVVETRKQGTLGCEWRIDPGCIDGAEPGADSQTLAKDLSEDLWNIDIHSVISQILDAPLFGYVPIELIWAPDGDKVRLKEIRPLPFRWFGFDHQNKPRFISAKNMIEGEELPPGKFVFARHKPSYDNPFGVRLLSRCFWPTVFKKGGLKYWVKFAEKFGSPFLLGKYQNQDQASKMLTALTRMVQDAVAVIPDGCTVEPIQANFAGSTDVFEKLKTAMDSEISKVILGQTLTTEVGNKGTQALGTVHENVLEAYQESDRKLITSVMEEIAWIYGQINDPTAPSPEWRWIEEKELSRDRADRDKVLADIGQVTFSQDYVDREYGFEDGDVVVKEKPAPVPPGLGMIPPPPLRPGNVPPTKDNPPADKGAKGKAVQATEAQFSEMAFPDQAAIDRLIASIPSGAMQGMVEPAVKPVIKLINEGANFSEVMEKLATIYPDMNTTQMEETLARATFVAEIWGRLNAAQP